LVYEARQRNVNWTVVRNINPTDRIFSGLFHATEH
jgi:hypothetical protein